MAHPLSPDRQYYWDGAAWVRATSPDGAWRWDGSAWRPVRQRPRSSARLWAIASAGVVAALLIAGLGVFAVARVMSNPSGLAGLGRTCGRSSDAPGAPLQSGDTVCGYRLGPTVLTASCAGAATLPDGLRAWQQGPNDTEATSYDMPIDDQGCDLDTTPQTTIWLQTRQSQAPDAVVVVDFVPHSDWGEIGIELGCNGTTCLNFFIDPAGIYRLDQKVSSDNWKIIARGPLPPFTLSHLNELDRLVVRYHDRGVQAFLNGYAVLSAGTPILEGAGDISVYSDDAVGSEPALVHVRTFDIFGTS